MQTKKRLLAAALAAIACLGLAACGKDFDAAGYTKSVLDANYHGEYADGRTVRWRESGCGVG